MAVKFPYRVCAEGCFLGFLVHSSLYAECPLPLGIVVLCGPGMWFSTEHGRLLWNSRDQGNVVRVPVSLALSLRVGCYPLLNVRHSLQQPLPMVTLFNF